jgi:hypothetical protein
MAAVGAKETVTKIISDAATNLKIPEADRAVFNERFMNSVNLEVMIERMVAVYDKHFNDGEIKDMQWFYATATGQKVIRESPVIYRECYELGLQWIAEEALKIPPRHPGNCKKPGSGPCIGESCHAWDPKVGCTFKGCDTCGWCVSDNCTYNGDDSADPCEGSHWKPKSEPVPVVLQSKTEGANMADLLETLYQSAEYLKILLQIEYKDISAKKPWIDFCNAFKALQDNIKDLPASTLKGYIKGGIDGHALDANCAAHDKAVKDAKSEQAEPTCKLCGQKLIHKDGCEYWCIYCGCTYDAFWKKEGKPPCATCGRPVETYLHTKEYLDSQPEPEPTISKKEREFLEYLKNAPTESMDHRIYLLGVGMTDRQKLDEMYRYFPHITKAVKEFKTDTSEISEIISKHLKIFNEFAVYCEKEKILNCSENFIPWLHGVGQEHLKKIMEANDVKTTGKSDRPEPRLSKADREYLERLKNAPNCNDCDEVDICKAPADLCPKEAIKNAERDAAELVAWGQKLDMADNAAKSEGANELTPAEKKALKELKSSKLGKKIVTLQKRLGYTDKDILHRANSPTDVRNDGIPAISSIRECDECKAKMVTNRTEEKYLCPACRAKAPIKVGDAVKVVQEDEAGLLARSQQRIVKEVMEPDGSQGRKIKVIGSIYWWDETRFVKADVPEPEQKAGPECKCYLGGGIQQVLEEDCPIHGKKTEAKPKKPICIDCGRIVIVGNMVAPGQVLCYDCCTKRGNLENRICVNCGEKFIVDMNLAPGLVMCYDCCENYGKAVKDAKVKRVKTMPCDWCDGKGVVSKEDTMLNLGPEKCAKCKGIGKIPESEFNLNPHFCKKCHKEKKFDGVEETYYCPDCDDGFTHVIGTKKKEPKTLRGRTHVCKVEDLKKAKK